MNFRGFMGSATNTLKIYSPHILLGVSIVSGIAAVVTAVMATPKALENNDLHEKNLEVINKAKEDGKTISGKDYSIQDYNNDNLSENLHHIGRQALVYLPTALLMGGSIGSALASFKIMNGRVAALNATVTAVTAALEAYRQRVIEDGGEEKDRQYWTGVKTEHIEETVKNPETKKKEVITRTEMRVDTSVNPDCPILSPYAVKIPKTNSNLERCKGDPLYVSQWLYLVCEEVNKKFYRCAAGDQKIFLIDVLKMFDITPMTDVDHAINWDIARANGWMNCKAYYSTLDKNKEIKEYTGDDIITCGYDNDPDNIYRVCMLVKEDTGDYYLDFNCFGNILYLKPVPYTKEELYDYWEEHPIVMK